VLNSQRTNDILETIVMGIRKLQIGLVLALSCAWGGFAHSQSLLGEAIAGLHTQPTSYTTMMNFIVELQQASPRISVGSIGTTHQGRQIPAITIRDPYRVGDSWRVLVIARQHGTEVAGTEAALQFTKFAAYSQHPELLAILKVTDFIIVPMANPDGAENRRRGNGAGVDLNRDWDSLSQPETKAIERLVGAWMPHVLVDMHEVPSGDRYPQPFIECLRENHTNTYAYASEVRAEQAAILSCLRLNGFEVAAYTASDSMDEGLSHRHFGLKYGIRSFLFESKQWGDSRGSLQERVRFHLTGLLALVIEVLNRHSSLAQPGWQYDPAQAAALSGMPPATAPGHGLPSLTDTPGGPPEPLPVPSSGIKVLGVKAGTLITQPTDVLIETAGLAQGQYLQIKLDGAGVQFTNSPSYTIKLDPAALEGTVHTLDIAIVNVHGEASATSSVAFLTTAQAEAAGQ